MSWKDYGTVTEILTNEGSNVADLAVSANTGASESYPEARIVIGSTRAAGPGGIDGFALSVKKWRELSAMVERVCEEITAECPAHGDPAKAAGGRPQALRAYLVSRWHELDLRVKLQAGQSHLADEAEKIGRFIHWMDEAGLGK